MTTLKEKLHQLEQLNTEHKGDWVADFEKVLADISTHREPGIIPALLGLLTDSSEFDEVLFSIVHTIERFPDSVYVAELLRASEELAQRAPRWAQILYMRALNNSSTRAVLSGELVGQPPSTRAAVAALLASIRSRRPELAAQVDEVAGTLSA